MLSLPSQIILRECDGLLLTAKPPGIPTHAPDKGKPGFVELLSERFGHPLKVCQRLDKETSGAIAFGISDPSTKMLCALFEARKVEKSYLLVTDRPGPHEDDLITTSYIHKRRGRFVSWREHETMNSETRFVRLKREGKFSLWRAEPRSGKPHQIRLHARDLGMSILGDSDHAGTRFCRLMLHAHTLSFPWSDRVVEHQAKASVLFHEPGRCMEAHLAEATLRKEGQYPLNR